MPIAKAVTVKDRHALQKNELELTYRGKAKLKDWMKREVAVGEYLNKDIEFVVYNAKNFKDQGLVLMFYSLLCRYKNDARVILCNSDKIDFSDERNTTMLSKDKLQPLCKLEEFIDSESSARSDESEFNAPEYIADNYGKNNLERRTSKLNLFYTANGTNFINSILNTFGRQVTRNVSEIITELEKNEAFSELQAKNGFYAKQIEEIYNMARQFALNFVGSRNLATRFEEEYADLFDGRVIFCPNIETGKIEAKELTGNKRYLNNSNKSVKIPIDLKTPKPHEFPKEITVSRNRESYGINDYTFMIFANRRLKEGPVFIDAINFNEKLEYTYNLYEEARLEPGAYICLVANSSIVDFTTDKFSNREETFKCMPFTHEVFHLGDEYTKLGDGLKWKKGEDDLPTPMRDDEPMDIG